MLDHLVTFTLVQIHLSQLLSELIYIPFLNLPTRVKLTPCRA